MHGSKELNHLGLHTGGRSGLVSIDLCNSSVRRSDSSIHFGSEGGGKVCGTIESGQQELSNLEEYTTLFQKQGGSKGEDGSQGEGAGAQSCLEEIDPGSTIGSSVGVDHLGLCNSSKLEETKFVKKKQESVLIGNDESGTFGICSRDCGAPNVETISGAPKILKEKEGENNNGKKVVFYRN